MFTNSTSRQQRCLTRLSPYVFTDTLVFTFSIMRLISAAKCCATLRVGVAKSIDFRLHVSVIFLPNYSQISFFWTYWRRSTIGFSFCFAFFLLVHQYKIEGLLRSESYQLSWVCGCFNCFTARLHYAIKSIFYADCGSWKMYMNEHTGCIDWENLLFYRNISLLWNRIAQPNADKVPHPPPYTKSLPFLPLFHPFWTWSSISSSSAPLLVLIPV